MAENNRARKILVVDETLREGMQFQGLVFSLEQRIKILEFQEALGVDICQAGYPSAHVLEAEIVAQVATHARKNKFATRTAALGRARIGDGKILCQARLDDLHFHLHVKDNLPPGEQTRAMDQVKTFVRQIRSWQPESAISIAMLDMGKTDPGLLGTWVRFLSQGLEVDIISLADTSGIMTPDQVHDKIQNLSPQDLKAKIAVHCHNDLGMASANSFMGILAGASVLEASALGIGERNGIADLYTTAKQLKAQGLELRIDTDNLVLFKAYYAYVDNIVREQTGQGLILCTTPVFGEAVKTHVAGTHAGGEFASTLEEKYFLNPLCGQGLVQKYLNQKKIPFPENRLVQITDSIKTHSFTLGRRLTRDEITTIARSFKFQP